MASSNTPSTSSPAATPSANKVQALNNWLQQSGRSPTLGWEEKCEGPTHAPNWIVTVFVEGKAMGTAEGSKKSVARNGAAKIALDTLHAEYLAAGGPQL